MFSFLKKKSEPQPKQPKYVGGSYIGSGNVFLDSVVQQSSSSNDSWINIKDKEPNDEDECHIILKNGQVVYGFYYAENKGFARADSMMIKNGKYMLDAYCDAYLDDVTHWRKLPELPKE